MAKKLVLERFTSPDSRLGGLDPVCTTLAELANLADSLDDLERKNFQDIICGIKNQKGAQVGDDQIEIRRKTCVQISLEDNQSQWVGIAVFHTSPRFRKNTISSPCPLPPPLFPGFRLLDKWDCIWGRWAGRSSLPLLVAFDEYKLWLKSGNE